MISLPSLPLCKINKTIEEEKEFREAFLKSNDQCFDTTNCIVLEYSADETNYRKSYENVTFEFKFIISTNSTTLYEEYWIYDEIHAIGSVGGTLGMCIGFSLTSLVSYLINISKHIISIIKAKIAHKFLSKPKFQFDSLERESNVKQNEMKTVEDHSRKEEYLEDEETLDEKIHKILEEKLKTIFLNLDKNGAIF